MTHIKKKIIGITGGIATGKSTFSDILKEMNYRIIDADKIAKDSMKKGGKSYNKTVSYFGNRILQEDGQVDRKALGNLVFNNPKLLKALNEITHPDIFQEIKNQIEESSRDLIFLDIPLLFEEYDRILEYGIDVHEIWLVYTDRNTQIDRLMERDSLSKAEAIRRIDSQLSIDIKRDRADRVILNLESIDKFKAEIDLLLKEIS